MTYGTRTLRVNLKAIVGLMRWPFPEGTFVHINDHKLPSDATFVRIAKVEDPYVYIVLASREWHGQTDEPVIPPQFKYETKGGHIALPRVEDIMRGGPN